MADTTRLAELVAELTTATKTAEIVDRLWNALPPDAATKLASEMLVRMGAEIEKNSSMKWRFEELLKQAMEKEALRLAKQRLVEMQFEEKILATMKLTVDAHVQQIIQSKVEEAVRDAVNHVRRRREGY